MSFVHCYVLRYLSPIRVSTWKVGLQFSLVQGEIRIYICTNIYYDSISIVEFIETELHHHIGGLYVA